jgi:mannose-6-phosphate isomerase-like protein (cupin superfamily)
VKDIETINVGFTDENYAQTEHRPWGFYTTLWEERGIKTKRIGVAPGGALSLQYHLHRSETWTVLSGKGRVTVGEKVFDASAGDRFDIAAGVIHRAESETGMVFFEVQKGEYLGEDDIVRLEDKYERA